MKIVEPRYNSDCVAACLASLLELRIEEVPEFWKAATGDKPSTRQYEAIRKWLVTKGYHYYYSEHSPKQFAEFQSGKFERGVSWPPRGYWLARITRVEWLIDDMPGHVVIMKGFKCVYNPSGTIKETKENDVFLTGYYLLVPLDPKEVK
jgi:hypothetical protein